MVASDAQGVVRTGRPGHVEEHRNDDIETKLAGMTVGTVLVGTALLGSAGPALAAAPAPSAGALAREPPVAPAPGCRAGRAAAGSVTNGLPCSPIYSLAGKTRQTRLGVLPTRSGDHQDAPVEQGGGQTSTTPRGQARPDRPAYPEVGDAASPCGRPTGPGTHPPFRGSRRTGSVNDLLSPQPRSS